MLLSSQSPSLSVAQRAAVASVLLAAASAATAALPQFVLSPGAVGLTGADVNADNILVSDYATVLFSGPNFTDEGFLSVTGFQQGQTTLAAGGLNTTYGLYIKFSGFGTGDMLQSLNYTLYGYSGAPAVFGFGVDLLPTVTTASAPIELAKGTLIAGKIFGDVMFGFTGAYAELSVQTVAPSFFQSPAPSFYGIAKTSFVNFGSSIQPVAGGFQVSQGGGTLAFAVPEPETYALMLCGLVAVGAAVRRRRGAPAQA